MPTRAKLLWRHVRSGVGGALAQEAPQLRHPGLLRERPYAYVGARRTCMYAAHEERGEPATPVLKRGVQEL